MAALWLQGIRILNYIDDWLILAQSQELVLWHRDVALTHLKTLGLRLNTILSSAQRTTYLGVAWDSITIIPLGLLHMRLFQLWIRTRAFHPRAKPQRNIRVMRQGLCSVSEFGPHSRCALLLQYVNGRHFPHRLGCGLRWPSRPRDLERSSSRLAHQLPPNDGCISALKYFLQQLRGYRVLVQVNKTGVVSYINRQGGLHSRRLNRQAQQILLWTQDKFLSLRVIYITGHMNVGADLLSRQAVTHRKWKLHPEVVSQIWERFYETVVDLFAWQETAQCPPYFFLISSAPLGLHAMVHTWPRLHLYAFPSITLLPEVLAKVRQQGPLTNKCIVGWPECDSQI